MADSSRVGSHAVVGRLLIATLIGLCTGSCTKRPTWSLTLANNCGDAVVCVVVPPAPSSHWGMIEAHSEYYRVVVGAGERITFTDRLPPHGGPQVINSSMIIGVRGRAETPGELRYYYIGREEVVGRELTVAISTERSSLPGLEKANEGDAYPKLSTTYDSNIERLDEFFDEPE